MKRLLPILLMLASACIGCNKSPGVAEAPEEGVTEAPVIDTPPMRHFGEAVDQESAPPPGATIAAPQPTSVLTPDVVVANFLAALRDGDDTTAESLLTTKVLEETSKRNLTVQPPGTPSANFQIGKVSYVTADKRGAHVSSVWSEKDRTGGAMTYEIVWALRHQQDGWKIAGMATQVTDDGPPVFLNFEDPDDMFRKWRDAERALAEQYQDDGVRQATRADTSAGSENFQR
ncbi:MAG: hypothetical protein ACC628_06670 [Pirellulaceae bacterium]